MDSTADQHSTQLEPQAAPPSPAAAPGPPRRGRRGFALLSTIVFAVTGLSILAFFGLLLRPNADPGIRVWMLNHQPDQAIVVNPFSGQVEKKFLVADGLRELAFSRDGERAYIASVVDVSNRVTVINTGSYLTEDEIEVDGVPQGIGLFPDDELMAVILGSKTDFMAGGFDVMNLEERSSADPMKRVRVYRERELALTHKIAIGDDGDRIYCIDAKRDQINIYSRDQKQRIDVVELHGSPEELLYPPVGDYYYVSVLQHYAVYQISKDTDEITAAFVYAVRDPSRRWERGKLRHMAVDNSGEYLFVSCYEDKGVGVWQLGNPEHQVDWRAYEPERIMQIESMQARDYPGFEASGMTLFEYTMQNALPHYSPMTRFKLTGGYRDGSSYVSGPKHLAVDELNQNLFVVDEEGGLYIYDFNAVLRAPEGEPLKAHAIVGEVGGQMRDMKVTKARVVRRRPVEGDG